MNTEARLLEWLEPPDNGLGELKEKITRRASRRKAVAGISAMALVITSAIAVFLDAGKSTAPPAVSDQQWQSAISMQEEKLRVINGAALELSAPDANTRIYLVSIMQEKTPPGSG